MLTTQGSYIFTKLRPVDQLQWLLETCKSGGGEVIEGFFKLHHVSVKINHNCKMCARGVVQAGKESKTSRFALSENQVKTLALEYYLSAYHFFSLLGIFRL